MQPTGMDTRSLHTMNIHEPRNQGMNFAVPFTPQQRRLRHKESTLSTRSNRLPFLSWLPDELRNHFVAMCGEFAGTLCFLFFAFSGTQVALLSTKVTSENVVGAESNPASLLYISLCFGFSLAVNAWVFFRISGGLFNPAVTVGMCLVGALPYIRGLLLLPVQILGAITAAAICKALFPGPLNVETTLGGGTSTVQGLFIEMFLTAQLVFTIFMLAAEKHRGTFIAPIGIGLSIFVAELTGVYFTGGAVNPARAIAPSVVNRNFVSYHWIYWIGPILGALVSSGFYKFIKMLEYETANPGQDHHKPMKDYEDLERLGTATGSRVNFALDDMESGNVPRSRGMSTNSGNNKEWGMNNDSRYFNSSAPPPMPMAHSEPFPMATYETSVHGGQTMNYPGSSSQNFGQSYQKEDPQNYQFHLSTRSADSDRTLAPQGGSSITTPPKSAIKPGRSMDHLNNVKFGFNSTRSNTNLNKKWFERQDSNSLDFDFDDDAGI